MPRYSQNKVFVDESGEGWRAVWRGRLSPILFNSKGAAYAYISTCNKQGCLKVTR